MFEHDSPPNNALRETTQPNTGLEELIPTPGGAVPDERTTEVKDAMLADARARLKLHGSNEPEKELGDESLDKVGESQGTNEGGWYERPSNGERLYAKFYKDTDQARVEYVANAIYARLGIGTVKSELTRIGGRLAVVSAEIPHAEAVTPEEQRKNAEIREGFVADAYLANRDVIGAGFDNILRDTEKKLIRCDAGGSLIFRAQGQRKEYDPHSIPELESMRNPRYPSGEVFEGLTEKEMAAQAQVIVDKLSPADIEDILETSGLFGDTAAKIRTGLLGRREFLIERFNLHERVREFVPTEYGESTEYKEGHPARDYLQHLIPDTLTQGQRDAIEHYSKSGFEVINADLVHGHWSSDVARIDEAMSQTRLPEATIVYRGASTETSIPDDFEKGTIFEEPGYTSTSLNLSVAINWNNSQTLLRIEAPAGTPVAVPHLTEGEILLPHGSKFEITGAETVEGLTLVHARLIPDPRAWEALGQNDSTPPTLEHKSDPEEATSAPISARSPDPGLAHKSKSGFLNHFRRKSKSSPEPQPQANDPWS